MNRMISQSKLFTFLLIFGLCFAFGFAVAAPLGSSGAVYNIVESIPIGMNLETEMHTADAWVQLINSATKSLDLALFYMELTNSSYWPAQDGGESGLQVFEAIVAAIQRGIPVRIAMSPPSPSMTDVDALTLASLGASVRFVDWDALFQPSGGILHTKLLIADSITYYLGSCNADWRSFTQVKELGIFVRNSTDTGADLQKLFDQYWYISNLTTLPKEWPTSYYSEYNITNPLQTILNNSDLSIFFAYSPPANMFSGFEIPSRTADLTAIQTALNEAEEFFALEVMDYIPITQFLTPNIFWPDIDSYIRSAAFRGVEVRLLVAKWNYSDPNMFQYLNSLATLNNVTVQLFEVPNMPNQEQQIPFTRVNHAKFFVTDKVVYIGTSNWVGDYFINTAGASATITSEMIRLDVLSRFERDWTSSYAHPIEVCVLTDESILPFDWLEGPPPPTRCPSGHHKTQTQSQNYQQRYKANTV